MGLKYDDVSITFLCPWHKCAMFLIPSSQNNSFDAKLDGEMFRPSKPRSQQDLNRIPIDTLR